MQKPEFEPIVQIRPKAIVQFYQCTNPKSFNRSSAIFTAHHKGVSYSGKVSAGAKKRMKKAIQTLLAVSPPQTVIHPQLEHPVRFRLNFFTLTLPSAQGELKDEELRKGGLEPFLLYLRRKHKVREYVWKAERQKNGNIHYHITSNKFVFYQEVQDEWNFRMKGLGLLDKFREKHKHTNPHSTEVKAVKKVDQIERYLQKYFMKDVADDKVIKGKVWDCSLSLKSVPWPFEVISGRIAHDLELLAKTLKDQCINDELYQVIWFSEQQRKKLLPKWAADLFDEYCRQVKSFERVRNGTV